MNNFDQVFRVFRNHYVLVPLEAFGSDPYKVLVSTVLSARTKDEVTLEASKRLFKVAPNLEQLGQLPARNASPARKAALNVAGGYSDAGGEISIEKLIYPVGFYKTKAKHLKKLAKTVLAKYDGKVPMTKSDLVSLPGVGVKTANLVLNRAFRIPAIAVDTHVHRISNLLGWVHTKTPEQTEKELVKIVPKKYWPDMNRLFVSIGRQFTSKKKLEVFLKKEKLI